MMNTFVGKSVTCAMSIICIHLIFLENRHIKQIKQSNKLKFTELLFFDDFSLFNLFILFDLWDFQKKIN